MPYMQFGFQQKVDFHSWLTALKITIYNVNYRGITYIGSVTFHHVNHVLMTCNSPSVFVLSVLVIIVPADVLAPNRHSNDHRVEHVFCFKFPLPLVTW